MRTLIVSEFVTLAGVMEAPGGEPSHPHTGWVMVFPVTIGSGLRVFPQTTSKAPWRMTETRTFPSGVRVDTFTPSSAPTGR